MTYLQNSKTDLDNYIDNLREEQFRIQTKMQNFQHSSWKSGEARDAFLAEWETIYSEFIRQVQILEDSLVRVIQEKNKIQNEVTALMLRRP